jgi:RimJ/RimL family protein N-acetyltransferase
VTPSLSTRPFPHLTVATPRLDVRPLSVTDASAVDGILADRAVQRWLPFPQDHPPVDGKAWCTIMADERRESGEGDHYGIVRRQDGETIGLLWTRCTDWLYRTTEVCCAVAADSRGFGVAAEAVDALTIALVLEHGFQRVELRVAPGNTASRRVAEKAGFTYEGLLRNAGSVHSGRIDLEVWSLVAGDLR